jgi:hypothetical protein
MTSTSGTQPPAGASAPRDDVVGTLRQAYADARLTLGEYTQRMGAASGAGSPEEMQQAAADLPETPALHPSSSSRRWIVAVMAGASRRGPWRPNERTKAVAFMGGCHLDLRDAHIAGETLDITAVAIMGGVTIVVPEGVEVAMSGFALMGGKSARIRNTRRLPDTPLVNVRARVLMGGVSVVNKRPKRRLQGPRHDQAVKL